MLLRAKMKFYVLGLVVWLPNEVQRTNHPKHVASLLYLPLVSSSDAMPFEEK
jgi:hypothetical protein